MAQLLRAWTSVLGIKSKLCNSVALGILLINSVLQFPYLQNRHNDSSYHTGLL